MTLAVFVLLAWVSITIFSFMPKKLSELDMVILYFIDTIFELSLFSVFHINLHLMEVSRHVDKSLADLTLRFITYPVLMVISSNVLMYSGKVLKWSIVPAMMVASILIQWLATEQRVVRLIHWNMAATLLMAIGYVAFSGLMAWLIVRAGSKEVKAHDSI